MSDPGALGGGGKNQADASSSCLPEGLPSFEEVTRSMQVFLLLPFLNHNDAKILKDYAHKMS